MSNIDHRQMLRRTLADSVQRPFRLIHVDFGSTGARPVTGQSRKCRLSNFPVEGIAIAQQIQARDTHYQDVGRAILSGSPIARGPTT